VFPVPKGNNIPSKNPFPTISAIAILNLSKRPSFSSILIGTFAELGAGFPEKGERLLFPANGKE
jgi:hypothetical protein